MHLTDKQAKFTEEFAVDLNATQAAIRAGYSISGARTEGARLLANADIAKAITKAKAAQSARTGIGADRILLELARLGTADIRNVVQWGDAVAVKDVETGEERIVQGLALVASADLTADAAASIAEVSQAKDGTLKVKLHDKNSALEKLGRHLGLFPNKVEMTGKDGGPLEVEEKSDRELAKILLSILARAQIASAETAQPSKEG